MESAIDQTYNKFESQFSDEVWWKEAKDRGLGFKVRNFLRLIYGYRKGLNFIRILI